MRLRRALGVAVLVSAVCAPGLVGSIAPAAAEPVNLDCSSPHNVGKALSTTPWPQKQLAYQELLPVTQGRYLASGTYEGTPFEAGQPVPVGLIDSGIETAKFHGGSNPVFRGAHLDVLPQVRPWRLPDCVGHGTAVASLIVGQPSAYFVGVAPQARLISVQYTNSLTNSSVKDLVAALKAMIAQHPRVINMSIQQSAVSTAELRELRTAAADGIIIVAAGGNDGSGADSCTRCYPAALSKQFPNIIAVSAVARNGQAPDFGVTGHYIDVAAPGAAVPVAQRLQGFGAEDGTSFATPFVTGTVALMLAAHPDMTPAQVKHRLQTTADPPPGTVPDSKYGYGTVDPVQAVTSTQDDAVSVPTPAPGPPLAAPGQQAGPDRTLQHRALAIAVTLLGLAALTVTAAAILRGRGRSQRS